MVPFVLRLVQFKLRAKLAARAASLNESRGNANERIPIRQLAAHLFLPEAAGHAHPHAQKC